jgi:hypothetical protein
VTRLRDSVTRSRSIDKLQALWCNLLLVLFPVLVVRCRHPRRNHPWLRMFQRQSKRPI